jgi:hypothetical protein
MLGMLVDSLGVGNQTGAISFASTNSENEISDLELPFSSLNVDDLYDA